MKRTPLQRCTPLRRKVVFTPPEPGRAEWKRPERGYCECCYRPCWRLWRHHVVYEQHVRREHGDPWALENAMLLCPDCHKDHHAGQRDGRPWRIPRGRVPVLAAAFAARLLGDDPARLYFDRYYA